MMSTFKKCNWALLVSAAAFSAAGCSADYVASPTAAPQLASIQIHYSRPHTFIAPGSSLSFILFAVSTDGVMENVTGRASWSTSDSRVIQAGAGGSVRAAAEGAADVIATYEGRTSTARVLVLRDRFFPYLELIPASTHQVGVESRAVATYVPGSIRQAVTNEASWTSSDPGVVTVERGVVIGRSPGTAAITAIFNGLTSTYYVSIPPLVKLP